MNKNKGNIKTKALGFIKRNGVFLVLGACFALLALATVLFGDFGGANPNDAGEVGQNNNQHLSEIQMPTPFHSATPNPSGTPAPDITPGNQTQTPKPATELLAPPVEGNIIWDYAMDELIYSKTLKHWTTHRGLDIAADEGTPVRCVAAGKIADVYKDDAFGISVVVDHGKGISTVYACLTDNVPVKKGDSIKKGGTLGYVGTSALSECADPPPLHVEYLMDGSPKNPRDYVFFS